MNFVLTKKKILTGSDRIASVKNKLKSKVYINVQELDELLLIQ